MRWPDTTLRSGSLGELGAVVYIALVAVIAQATGFIYVLFPELGALSHDVLKRPHGRWARSPLMLVLTPFLTALVGTFITRHFPYGVSSLLFTIACAIFLIQILRSPIAPAISAGLLPLTLGLTSWWYPPSLLIGTVLLAGISLVWRRIIPFPASAGSASDYAEDIVEEAPTDYAYIPFFLGFLIIASTTAGVTGWRFLLFPPLVVIGFEMFAHAPICPWASRPLVLPVACTLTATAGVLLVTLLGVGPLAAAISIGLGIVILRIFDLHVPPALAVALLPFVMAHPDYRFPISVGAGTLLLTSSFVIWRKVVP